MIDRDEAVRKALEDLEERLDVAEGEVTVESVEEVTWPDTSLGCPEEGKMYAQVLTPGYRIVLRARGTRYTYHAGGSRVVCCEDSEVA